MAAVMLGPPPPDDVIKGAVEYVRGLLPEAGVYRAWRGYTLSDPQDGRKLPVDLMVLTLRGLWVIDVQPHTGELHVDEEAWWWDKDGELAIREPPFIALGERVRRLRSRLQAHGLGAIDVRPLVLLGAEKDVSLGFPNPLERDDITARGDAPVEGVRPLKDVLLAAPEPGQHVVTPELGQRLADALPALGAQPVQHRDVVGRWRLGALQSDHEVWQEHEATHTGDPERRARIRTWVLPRDASDSQRDALRRAATREAEVLGVLGQHPHILGLLETVDHDDGARLVFEPFDGGQPLQRFLRAHQDLSFDDRLAILEQVAMALDHCHRHEVIHRNLSPDAVLVRLDREGRPEVRLHHFEGAVARQAEATTLGTRHLTHFTERLNALYRAEEIFRDPDAATEQSDLFSLGALSWFLFVGRHPGPTIRHRTQRLHEGDGLRLWEVRDDLDLELDELVAKATRPRAHERDPSVRGWINKVVGLYRELEDADADPVDPLVASRGDPLGHDLRVLTLLGTGASARVLYVDRDGDKGALKVPLSDSAQALIEAEHAVLSRLSHPNIIKVEELVTLSQRRCLLMQFAGEHTLADSVRREGTLPLDYAQRLGDELLSALEYLHGQGVTHRDIKPANLSFNSISNQSRSLLLFDFSLASQPPEGVGAGTKGWRDPTLFERGAWDPQADLFAAAAVLHYALTGVRPAWDEREYAVQIEESRFDPDLRGALSGFFRAALAARAEDRPADADAMRRAWARVFATDTSSLPTDADAALDQRLARARLETPIGALGLSSRALDALTRAGVVNVRDLLALPRNRLSFVRGVGRETRDDILRAVELLDRHLGKRDDLGVAPFLDAPALPSQPLEQLDLGLTEAALAALTDAGMRTAVDLARAGAGRVERLVRPHGVDPAELARRLQAFVPDAPMSGPLGDWLNTLLRPHSPGSRRKWEERAGVLFGLDPLPGAAADGAADDAPPGGRTNAAVAAALGISSVVLRSSFHGARKHWDKHPAVRDAAVAAVGAALDRLGAPAPLEDVGAALLEDQAPALVGDPRALVQAIALVRFGTEVGIPDPPFCWRRVGRRAWLARDEATLSALEALGRAADRLALSDQPVPLEPAAAALRPLSAALAARGAETLVRLAAAASEGAAVSPRLEIYPRGLPAARAVELSGAVLTPGLTAAEVRKRVAARYPDAEPLPARPALDGLLAPVGLRWSADKDAYLRPGVQGSTLTRGSDLTSAEAWRTSAASLPFGRPTLPASARAARFATALKHSVETGRFRAIQVSARRSEEAARALLAAVPGLVLTDVDAALLEGLAAHVAEQEADPAFIREVDRGGPEGEHWAAFLEYFIEPVVRGLVARWLSPEGRARPRLLVHPGLLARYGQAAALDALVRRVESEEGAAVWLLLPAWDDGANPKVRHPHGDLPVPVYLPAQRLRAPRTWIQETLKVM